MTELRRVLVTGGAGYVGSVLVPKLLQAGFDTTVIDLYLYGDDVLASVKGNSLLKEVKGDIRNLELMRKLCAETDAVIHLACISNDPSFELNPTLGKSINYDATVQLIHLAKEAGVNRFIYASSSSVYGVKKEENVTEELPLKPLTDYSKFKAMCEEVLLKEQTLHFVPVVLRPATVCGYSPRLRLDLTVNILTCHAVLKGKITVFGGVQKRPNIHIEDVSDLYVNLLRYPDNKVAGGIFNAGYENHSLMQLAEIVKEVVGGKVTIDVAPTDDIRSYHICSEKILRELGFEPRHTIAEAVADLKAAFAQGQIQNAMSDSRYYNIKKMQEVQLT